MITTNNSGSILAPSQVEDLLVKPVLRQSVAARVAKVVRTSASSIRLPVVNADPSAAWTAEGAEIAISDPEIAEIEIRFSKLAGLTVVSNELVDDSSPEASGLVGDGLSRDIVRQLDSAFFGSSVANGPNGIGSLAGVQVVDAGADWSNLDPFHEALSLSESVGATVGAFVTTPAVALELAKLKTGSGSNAHLLGPDPTSPTARAVAGVPLFVTPAVEAGSVWAVPLDRTVIGLRKDVNVETDRSAFFSSDRTAVRAVLRAGFGFPHPEAVVKIATTGS